MSSFQLGILLIVIGLVQLTMPTNEGTTILAVVYILVCGTYVYGILRED